MPHFVESAIVRKYLSIMEERLPSFMSLRGKPAFEDPIRLIRETL